VNPLRHRAVVPGACRTLQLAVPEPALAEPARGTPTLASLVFRRLLRRSPSAGATARPPAARGVAPAMPRAVDAHPWILPLVLQQLSVDPREPDLIGCKALVLSVLTQARRMELFDGAHTLRVSLSIEAIRDLDSDEDALGITSKNLVGHIVAVAGLTLVPDLYSAPPGVIAVVSKVTPFCDKLQRPINRPPLVESAPAVRKILSARLGQVMSSYAAPAFLQSGSGGATGAASVSSRPAGAPPPDLLANVTDFKTGLNLCANAPARGSERPVGAGPDAVGAKGTASVVPVPKPLPPLRQANFASGAAAAAAPPQPWGRGFLSSALATFSKPAAAKDTAENCNNAEAGTPCKPAAAPNGSPSTLEKPQDVKKGTERFQELSSSSGRSGAPEVPEMRELGEDDRERCDVESHRQDISRAKVTVPALAHASASSVAAQNPVDGNASMIKAPAAFERSGALDVVAEFSVPARGAANFAQEIPPVRDASVNEAAGKASTAEQRGDSISEAPVAKQTDVKSHDEAGDDGQSTQYIPKEDLPRLASADEAVHNANANSLTGRTRSSVTASRNAGLALAGVHSPTKAATVDSDDARELEQGVRAANDSPVEAAHAGNAEADVHESTGSVGDAPKNDNAMIDIGEETDSLDDEEGADYGPNRLPETQGNMIMPEEVINTGPSGAHSAVDTDGNTGLADDPLNLTVSRPDVLHDDDMAVSETPPMEIAPCLSVSGNAGDSPDSHKQLAARKRGRGPSSESGERELKRKRADDDAVPGEKPISNGNGSMRRRLGVDAGPEPEANAEAVHRTQKSSSHTPVERLTVARGVSPPRLRSQYVPERQRSSAAAGMPAGPPANDVGTDSETGLGLRSMYEEAAKMISRLKALDNVQSCNPWHACLAPKSILNGAHNQQVDIALLQRSLRKRRRSTGALLASKSGGTTDGMRHESGDRRTSLPARVAAEGDDRMVVNADAGGGVAHQELMPVSKRNRKNSRPRQAEDPATVDIDDEEIVVVSALRQATDDEGAQADGDVDKAEELEVAENRDAVRDDVEAGGDKVAAAGNGRGRSESSEPTLADVDRPGMRVARPKSPRPDRNLASIVERRWRADQGKSGPELLALFRPLASVAPKDTRKIEEIARLVVAALRRDLECDTA
jgi:hypothetical protein